MIVSVDEKTWYKIGDYKDCTTIGSLQFTMPKGVPAACSGAAGCTFGWLWTPIFSGTCEIYMNCYQLKVRVVAIVHIRTRIRTTHSDTDRHTRTNAHSTYHCRRSRAPWAASRQPRTARSSFRLANVFAPTPTRNTPPCSATSSARMPPTLTRQAVAPRSHLPPPNRRSTTHPSPSPPATTHPLANPGRCSCPLVSRRCTRSVGYRS